MKAPGAFADFGFRNDKRPKLFGRHEERLHVGDGVRIDERWLARQLADFGGEISGPELDDRADAA